MVTKLLSPCRARRVRLPGRDGLPGVGRRTGLRRLPALADLGLFGFRRRLHLEGEGVLGPAFGRLAVDPHGVPVFADVSDGGAGVDRGGLGSGVSELEADLGQAAHLSFHLAVTEQTAACCGQRAAAERSQVL